MLGHRPHAHSKRRSQHAPFPRILCAVDGSEASAIAVEQAMAVADGDAHVVFGAVWYGTGSSERAAASDEQAREAAAAAVERACSAGVQASVQYFHAPRIADALLSSTALHDLIVVGAHPHARATGIVLAETATLLVHRCAVPVLIARDRPLDAGIVAATRALPDDRIALTVATHLAARLGAELTVVHVPSRHDDKRRAELRAELANARALLGRPIDYVDFEGPPARTIVSVAEGDRAGLVVVGSQRKQGVPALRSVSERVAHTAPCSVLVMRGL